MVLKSGFTQEKVNAYHEAGHAVIGALEGPGTDVTTIDRTKVLALDGVPLIGLTKWLGTNDVYLSVDTYLSLALAGVTSEAMYATNGVVSSHEDDFVHANEILDKAGLRGAQRDSKLLGARVKTEALIKKYEKEIQLVGDALVERKTLNADDIRELLGSNGLSREELQQQ